MARTMGSSSQRSLAEWIVFANNNKISSFAADEFTFVLAAYYTIAIDYRPNRLTSQVNHLDHDS